MTRSTVLLFVVAGVFLAGAIYMLNVEFDTGDLYPEYSTLRTDPRGARLIYDSLAQIPGVTVARNYTPLENLDDPHSSILLLGLPHSFESADQLKLYERLATRGARVIGAFAPPWTFRGREALPSHKALSPLGKEWGVELGTDEHLKRTNGQYFSRAENWQPVEYEEGKLTAIERRFGEGAIVLLASSEDFTNESAIRMDRLDAVTTILGEPKRIVFDEAHLGIAETGSVVGLARRFRLSGMAFGLAICAALFIWRNAAAFPPPGPARSSGSFSGRTSRAGLLTLLHRHIPKSALLTTCWQQWLSTNRRSVPEQRLNRAAAVAANPDAEPLQAVREIQVILRGRESSQ